MTLKTVDRRRCGVVLSSMVLAFGVWHVPGTRVAAQDGSQPVLYRVNAGGPVVSGTPDWSADTRLAPSPYVNASQARNRTYETTATIDVSHPSIPIGTPAALFQSERWDPPEGAEMLWSFPVAPGDYEVRLYFAEIGFTSPGARVFDVLIEGNLVLADYDIVADVGAFKGVVKSFLVTSDASLNILFNRVVENPKISAIEILDATSRPGEIGVVPDSLDFGAVLLGQGSARGIQLTNLGGSGDPSIDIYATTITGTDANQFADDFSDTVPVTLSPGQSTTITVGFAPTATGTKAAALEILHTGINSPIVVPLAGTGTSIPPGTWASRAPSGLARQEVSYVQVDGKFYLGFGSTAHEVYNPATNSWATLMPLPADLDHIQGVAFGGRIYYIGGMLGWPQPVSSAVYIYDPATDSFTQGAPMTRPRGAGGVAVHNGKIYYAGGVAEGAAVSWFDVYDPVANTWAPLPDMPVARDHFHAAVVNGKFYVTGGRALSVNATISSTIAFDFGTGTWQTSGLAPIPTPRGGFGVAVIGSEILVIGGEGGGLTFSTVEAYDTSTNTWRTLASMPTPRHGIQAAECNGGVYVAGGGTTQGGGSPTSVHEVFFLGSSTTCGTATSPPGGTLYRVNAGGPVISGTPNWSADTGASTSPYSNASASGSKVFSTNTTVSVSHPSLSADTPPNLFQTERWDPAGAAEMHWSFPVTPGTYEVRLYFAEIFFTSPGERVFDVSIEGTLALDDYDIVADVGPFRGVMKSFTVTADANLDIVFGHVFENPKISGIEILDATPRPGEIGVVPTSAVFDTIALGQTTTRTVQVKNLGGSGDPDIVIDATTITGADAGQFSDDFNDASDVTLGPGQSVAITVTFAPSSIGTKAASLAILHSGINTPAVVPLSGTATELPTGTWHVLAPAGVNRHEVSYVHVNGKFYLTGDRGNVLNEVYNPASNTWSTGPPLPEEFHHAQAVELNGLIYYAAGFAGPYPDHVIPNVHIFNPATGTWSQGTSMPAHRARGGGGTALYQGRIYVAGGLKDTPDGTGHSGMTVSLFDVYDPVAGTWTPLPDMPRPRDHFHAAVVGNKFYAIAGRKGDEPGIFNAVIAPVDVYDFTTGTWSALPASANIPTPRAGTAAAVLGNEIVIIGGEGNGQAYKTVEAFNVTTQTWRTLAPMPTARHGIQAAVCNGGIYVVAGGAAQGGGTLTKVHEVFFLGNPTPCGAAPVGFSKSTLAGTSGLSNPTSLQFGPDGRLYVSQQNGFIRVYTVTRNETDSYAVTLGETITSIQSVPNHNDDGQLNPNVTTRLITGILVVGTAANPVIYVAHSDPRIGGGTLGDLNLDTNSSMISRLTWTGATWQKLDLVRGLPRSEENHAANGMQLDPLNNILYVAVGGNTNKGAPSAGFANLPEFALSAAILSIDLAAIGSTTYDLPTLDDEDRPGNPDFNDPFGGNNGKNQAKLVPGGPVQVYAPGFRNAYDLVITQGGRMYTIDNGGNAGWGDIPVGEGPGGTCTNAPNEPGTSDPDSLHLITGAGYYGGHPNPTRANMANTFNASNPQSPVSVPNSIECDYRQPGPASGALATFGASTNGLTEYTADNFGGAMGGDLLAASWNGIVYRIQLDSTGTVANQVTSLFSSVGNLPLDVDALGPNAPFPGTIWVGLYGASQIVVFEPNDYDTAAPPCSGAYDWNLDEDGDGYSNADEIDNGTNPCSAGDVPPDWDGDFLSDLNDPDDDNDGIPDTSDPFALDPFNGLATRIPVAYEWENDGSNPGGILNLGFTGLMTNGVSDYATLFDPNHMTAGGAAGVLTVDQVPEGDAFGALNTQQYGLQFGLWANPADTGPFYVQTRILSPFAGLTPQDGQSLGLFVGTGDQDSYAKIVVSGAGGGGIIFQQEVGGAVSPEVWTPVGLPGPNYIDLYLRIDPARATVQPFYSVTSGGVSGPQIILAPPQPVPPSWFTNPDVGLAVGIISTSRGSGSPFPATWDFIRALPATEMPTLAVTPGSLDFGSVVVGEAWPLTLQLTNLGGADTAELALDGMTIAGADASQFTHGFDNTSGMTLVPGETATVGVTFAPTTPGAKAATLAIAHSISPTPFQVPLAGTGVDSGTPLLGASPSSLALGNVIVGQNANLAVQLTNLGTTNLVVGATTITGAAATQFTDDFNDASDITLAPGASTTVTVTFAPTSTGTKSATLEIAHSGGNSPLLVPLTGTGTSTSMSATVVYRVNAGGPTVSDNPNWIADSPPSAYTNASASGSKTYATSATIDVTHPSLPSGIPASLFQSERWDPSSGAEMQWSFPVTPGSYEVRLYFAELYFTTAGQRVFDVLVEGNLVLDNYDVVADVGAFTGVMKSFTVTADANLDIVFGHVVENPKISAIEILDVSHRPDEIGVLPDSLGFGAVVVGQASSGAIEVTNLGGAGDPHIVIEAATITGTDATEFTHDFNGTGTVTLTPGASITITVGFTPNATGTKTAALGIAHSGLASPAIVPLSGTGTSAPALYRVNAGGPTVSGTPDWSADSAPAPSPYVNAAATGNRTYTTSATIDMSHPSLPANTPESLFKTERYDPAGGAEMQWSFPVPPGNYEVRLYFAELYFTSPGQRVFNVTIEGTQVLTQYDIVAEAGAFKGVMRSFTVAADASIEILFGHVVENPKISAIEIFAVDDETIAGTEVNPFAGDLGDGAAVPRAPGHPKGVRSSQLPASMWASAPMPRSGGEGRLAAPHSQTGAERSSARRGPRLRARRRPSTTGPPAVAAGNPFHQHAAAQSYA